MPSRGRVDTRAYAENEIEAQKNASFFGEETHDIWINTQTYWRNVPSSVWDFHIGGYQVLKKWLSYREETVLRRAITLDEVKHFAETARRLAGCGLSNASDSGSGCARLRQKRGGRFRVQKAARERASARTIKFPPGRCSSRTAALGAAERLRHLPSHPWLFTSPRVRQLSTGR